MRYLTTMWILVLLLVLPAVRAYSQPRQPLPTAPTDGHPPLPPYLSWAETAFALSAGYRADTLNWHIAGNRQGSDPNVRSELTWSDLAVFQLKLSNRTVIRERLYLRGYVDYGMVVSGNNQDSDYNGNDRTAEFSRSVNGVDGNNVWDGSIGGGPRFSFFDASLVVCPLLGYAISEQDLTIVDGNQVLTAPPARTPTGPIDGLDSRYQTSWVGPWIGVDLSFSVPFKEGTLRSMEIVFTGEYHWVDYEADANWNLRTDYQHPVSFSHTATGTGIVLGTTIRLQTRSRWGFDVGMNVQAMSTDEGVDRIFYADGTTIDTQLNEVRWRAFTFEVGLTYSF